MRYKKPYAVFFTWFMFKKQKTLYPITKKTQKICSCFDTYLANYTLTNNQRELSKTLKIVTYLAMLLDEMVHDFFASCRK